MTQKHAQRHRGNTVTGESRDGSRLLPPKNSFWLVWRSSCHRYLGPEYHRNAFAAADLAPDCTGNTPPDPQAGFKSWLHGGEGKEMLGRQKRKRHIREWEEVIRTGMEGRGGRRKGTYPCLTTPHKILRVNPQMNTRA